jgi:hypothetical protein
MKVSYGFGISRAKSTRPARKLLHIFRNINIAFVNQLALLCERMDLDVWEVISAAATKPFGFMKFTPGPGVGGHCIPVDPYYLSWRAREFDFIDRFIETAADINFACCATSWTRGEAPTTAAWLKARRSVPVSRSAEHPGRPQLARGDARGSPSASAGALCDRTSRPSVTPSRKRETSPSTRTDWADGIVVVTAHVPSTGRRLRPRRSRGRRRQPGGRSIRPARSRAPASAGRSRRPAVIVQADRPADRAPRAPRR